MDTREYSGGGGWLRVENIAAGGGNRTDAVRELLRRMACPADAPLEGVPPEKEADA